MTNTEKYEQQFLTLKEKYIKSDGDLDVWDEIKDLHLEVTALSADCFEDATGETEDSKRQAVLTQADCFSKLAKDIHNFLHNS